MRLLRPLPRLRGRDREGARNKIPGGTPSPTLPRKRERERTEFAGTSGKISDYTATTLLTTSRGYARRYAASLIEGVFSRRS
jgi:hypothetical protein